MQRSSRTLAIPATPWLSSTFFHGEVSARQDHGNLKSFLLRISLPGPAARSLFLLIISIDASSFTSCVYASDNVIYGIHFRTIDGKGNTNMSMVKMVNKILVVAMVIAGNYGCQRSNDDTFQPTISANNISRTPSSFIQKLDFTKSNSTIVFGDSWSDFSVQPNNYVKIFSDSSRQLIINNAKNGLGGANMIAKAFATMDPTHNDANIITLCGFNDVRYAGPKPEVLNFQKNAYRMLLANQFTDTWRPAGSADRTGGAINSLNHSLGIHFKSSYSADKKAVYATATNGVYLEYDFTGTNVGISFVGQDTTAIMPNEKPIGRWRVLIDGKLIDTPSVYQQTYGHMPRNMASQIVFPCPKIYSGLSGTHHVLRLEPVGTGNKYVDCVFTLRDPLSVMPIAIMEVPYMTQRGYTIQSFANKANDDAIDKVNAAINDVANEFITINAAYSKKIKVINTADYFNRDTDYSSDLIHPNALGHLNLFKALKNHINY